MAATRRSSSSCRASHMTLRGVSEESEPRIKVLPLREAVKMMEKAGHRWKSMEIDGNQWKSMEIDIEAEFRARIRRQELCATRV